jgi:hypothetical protein
LIILTKILELLEYGARGVLHSKEIFYSDIKDLNCMSDILSEPRRAQTVFNVYDTETKQKYTNLSSDELQELCKNDINNLFGYCDNQKRGAVVLITAPKFIWSLLDYCNEVGYTRLLDERQEYYHRSNLQRIIRDTYINSKLHQSNSQNKPDIRFEFSEDNFPIERDSTGLFYKTANDLIYYVALDGQDFSICDNKDLGLFWQEKMTVRYSSSFPDCEIYKYYNLLDFYSILSDFIPDNRNITKILVGVHPIHSHSYGYSSFYLLDYNQKIASLVVKNKILGD